MKLRMLVVGAAAVAMSAGLVAVGASAQPAKDGAEKAKKGDIDGAKASCKACHDLYKAEYKAKHRDAAF